MTQNPATPESSADPAIRQRRILCLLLALVTLVLYLPVRGFDFNNYDDRQYITLNPWVQYGLGHETIAWAFTSGYASNWHPLTWLSHMLDWQFYGPNAGGHHLTSVLFHIANVLLLFGLLRRMTGALWRSAFVAAVFAWHPLRVESVAWVAERKDVLSAFFGLLTLWAWFYYVKSRELNRDTQSSHAPNLKSKLFYVLALLMFAFGLMSKPMLVSLPAILLLLDYWPLNRISGFQFPPASNAPANQRAETLTWLTAEKTPFFLLAALSCCVTYLVQKAGGATSVLKLSWPERAANALHSYAGYLGKIFWPRGLAVLYPFPHDLPLWQVAAAALLLAAVTVVVARLARRQPSLVVGWLWFVIMLVPVIGLVQVGEQAMADRYTYLPAIGIAIIVAWGTPGLLALWHVPKWFLPAVSGLALAACLAVTSRQLQYWRDSISLFSHAIDVTSENAVAQCNLAEALATSGDLDQAWKHINEALRIRPNYPHALNNQALILSRRGQTDQAIAVLRQTVAMKPDWPDAHRNLGQILLDAGRLDEAAVEFRKVIELTPADVRSLTDLGIVFARQGRLDEAIAQCRKALAVVPNAFAENTLASAFDAQGHAEEAAQHYQAAIQLKPDFVEARNNLGALLNSARHFPEARDQLIAALKIKPDFADARFNLANSYLALGDLSNATVQYSADLAIQTNDVEAHFDLARIFAHDRNWAGATNHYLAALALKPDLAEAHVGLASVYVQLGDDFAAAHELREAIDLGHQPASVSRNLAWLLATAPEPGLRAGAEAVRLCANADHQSPPASATDWDISAASYAEALRFQEALAAAKKALDLANAAGQKGLAVEIQKRLELYQTGTPYRQPSR